MNMLQWSDSETSAKAALLLERFVKHYRNSPDCIYAESAYMFVKTFWQQIDTHACNPEEQNEILGEIRRIYHTLKGSGRLVGAL